MKLGMTVTSHSSVIPAKAGIQGFRVRQAAQADALDSRLRGNDEA
jgi:hypothetical protein